ncbi:hypothetical protein [Marinobacter gelidimuriae]|uniref:hypothetical protein n=1 Tax=Marinobacter gelidimuriae TaxID=2739064 RepID=UPI0003630E02|nr:hypothetical protein [Marinobacter gelidimuriae]
MSFNVFEQARAQLHEQNASQAAARQAAYGSLSTLRIVSKALAGSVTVDSVGDPEAIEKAAKAMIERIGDQTIALNDRLGGSDDRIVLESITGSVATVISEHYRHSGQNAFKVDWSEVLAGTLEIDGIWRETQDTTSGGSLEYRRSLSMMQALAPVLSAHQRFDFFQPAENRVIERMGQLMWETTQTTLSSEAAVESMEEPEVEMLRRNLLLRAGELLAGAWNANACAVVQQVKEAMTDERRFWKSKGFPVSSVERDFLSGYRSLEQAFSVSLNAHQDAAMSSVESPSPS